jgi:hypothetical protein
MKHDDAVLGLGILLACLAALVAAIGELAALAGFVAGIMATIGAAGMVASEIVDGGGTNEASIKDGVTRNEDAPQR